MDAAGDVQNNGASTPTGGGVTGKGFQPGQSGNPGGRPKNFGLYIRQQTRDGQELVDYALEVFRGKHGADPKLQMDAMTWLADRGFGKPIQTTELTGKDGAPLGGGWDLSRLSDQEIEDAERLARAAAAPDAG